LRIEATATYVWVISQQECLSALPSLHEIQSDFAVLDEWEDRYRYLIELGRTLQPMPEAEKTEASKVRGCASQVWLTSHVEPGGGDARFTFRADSDAHIVRGLIAILVAIYDKHPVGEILAIDPDPVFDALGLKEHLTPQRSNGLASMVARIRSEATAAVGSTATAS
jgi:cysteine desulfuration protein SufE